MPTRAELVTPERVLFGGEAEFVVMRTDGGEIMFLPNHADFVGAVDICVARIAVASGSGSGSGESAPPAHGEPAGSGSAGSPGSGNEVRAAVHGGFVHVAGNRVTILASVAELAEDIDVDRARRALEAAEAAVASGEDGASQGGSSSASGHAPSQATAQAATTSSGDHEAPAAEAIEESPTMLALLYPDDPSVRLRRAQARLEAAGALEGASPPTH